MNHPYSVKVAYITIIFLFTQILIPLLSDLPYNSESQTHDTGTTQVHTYTGTHVHPLKTEH